MNELIFNGKRLSEFGAFYDSHQAFNTPERDLEYVEILGRDGDLIIDNDRFKNIEINFPCYIPTDFLPKYRSLMAYLNSQRGYKRLEYSQEPDHYRMASFAGNVEASPLQLHRAGRFTLPFICKPQRYLKSGEIPVPVSPVTETTSGNPAVIDNMSNLVQVDDLQIAIEPVQDLHGYDSPWAGGAGKNLLPPTIYNLASNSGAVVSDSSYRSMVAEVIGGETYTISRDVVSGNRFHIYGTKTQPAVGVATHIIAQRNSDLSITFTVSTTDNYILVYLANDGSEITSKIQLETGSTATAYEPYENICPITGHTSATVTSALKNLLQNTSSSSINHGITFTKQSDSTVVANGTADGDASFIINFTWNLDDGDYQLSGCAEGGSADKYYCFLWDRNANTRAKDWGGNASESSFNPTQIVKVRLEHGVNYDFYLRVKAGVTVSNIIFYPMICAKYHGTVYIKYTAKTVTCDFGRTVYGGYLDVTTGVLTVTHKLLEFDGVTTGKKVTSKGSGNENNYYLNLSDGSAYGMTSAGFVTRDKLLSYGYWCSNLRIGSTSGSRTFPYMSAYVNASSNFQPRIFFGTESDVTTVDLANAWLADLYSAGKPLQIVYALKEPIEVQLTPSILKLSSGVTYNFADTGRIVSIRTISPATLTNPTRFESKPIIRVWGNGTLNVNSYYITVANSPYDYIDIDCELMDCYHGSNNANQYVTFSTTGFVTLNSGANYFGYSGFSGVHVIPRWYEV